MKLNLLFILFLSSSVLSAQSFVETTPTMPINGVSHSAIAFTDVDGDGDQDLLVTGRTRTPEAQLVEIAKLYLNDGAGVYTEVPDTPFEGVEFSSIAFADIDNDNDQDLLISGRDSAANRISTLYTNDGGSFTEVMNTPFVGVNSCSVAFADIDGDNDQDVLITGQSISNVRVAKLYTNDGAGVFTEVMNTPFDGVQHSAIAFADVDGDNDQDVLITGNNIEFENIAKLYTNDGAGVFTEVMNAGLGGVEFGAVAFADIDGDNDLDVLIAGREADDTPVAKLYTNDGGIFTEVMGTTFEAIDLASIAFADVDGDGDQDVALVGRNSSFQRSTKLFLNDSGDFTELAVNPFIPVSSGSVAFADVDGDNDQDLLFTGFNGSNHPISTIYSNEGPISGLFAAPNQLDFDFTLYPNPTKADQITINFLAEGNKSLTATVFDLYGRMLIQREILAGSEQEGFSIDISSLSMGTYVVQLENEKRFGVRRVLIR